MGIDDMRAALLYQRATSEADQRIADRLSALVDGIEPDDDGMAGALVPALNGPAMARRRGWRQR